MNFNSLYYNLLLFDRLLGKLCKCITSFKWNNLQEEEPVDCLSKLMIFHLMSNSALQRFVVAQVIYMWGCETLVRKVY